MKRNRIFILIAFAISMVLASCEVGLGNAVDTEPPSVSISYPSSGSVVRDWFYVAGNCSDDVKVSSVVVTVSILDGKYENGKLQVGSYNAEVNNNSKTYRCKINNAVTGGYNGWELADGKYDISVVAYDDSGRTSGTSSISLNVDNTPPLMILTTPGSAAPNEPNQAPSEFGTVVKLAGTIVDENTVKSIRMRAYDSVQADPDALDPTTKDWTETSINTAGGTEVVFAQYIESETDPNSLGGRYSALYPNSVTGDMFYNLYFVVTDEAKLFQDPTEGENTTTGNATNAFFFNDDVSAEWNNESNGLDYKKVLQIINGTTTITDATIKTDVKNLFNSAKQKYATCKINKDASPKYSVLGYSAGENGINLGEDNKSNIGAASGGGAITVQAQMGRNRVTVKPNTLRVFQIGPFEYVEKAQADAIYSEVCTHADFKSDITGTVNHSFTGVGTYKVVQLRGTSDDEAKKNNSASSELYPYTVKADPGVVGGKCYIIAATGKDTSGKDITNDGYYVFKGASSDVPPNIEWRSEKIASLNDVADRGYINRANLKFGGTYSTTSQITQATYSVSITGENGTPNPSANTITGTINYDTIGNWSIDLSNGTGYLAPASGKEYLYTITVTMKNSGGTATNSHKIHVDTKQPSISIAAITPIIEKEIVTGQGNRNCVNGKIKIQGSVEDTSLNDVNLDIYYSNSGELLTTIPLGKTYTINTTFDTTSARNNNDFEIRIRALDDAGNEKVYTSTDYLGSSNPLYLDQSTDIPVLTPNNFSKITSKASIQNETNVFDASSNNKISGTITDDDGIQEVYVYYYLEDGVTLISSSTTPSLSACGLTANPVTLDAKSSTSYALNQKLPAKDGIYYVEVKAKDTDGYRTTPASVCEKFCVGVDTASPKIKEIAINTENSQFVKADGNKVFSGNVSDGWEVSSLTVSVKKGTPISIPIATDKTWTYTFNSADYSNAEGDYDLIFTVKDRAGKEASVTRNINIDNTPPTITSCAINATSSKETTNYVTGTQKQWVRKNSYNVIIGYDISKSANEDTATYWYNSNQLPVKVVTDDDSGIATVECCTDYNSSTQTGSWSSLVKGTTSWTGSATCNNQGSNTIWFRVTDNAGNQSQNNISVYVDTVEPDGLNSKLVNGVNTDTVYVATNGSIQFVVEPVDNGTVGTNSTGIGLVYYDNIYVNAPDATGKWTLTIPWTKISAMTGSTNSIKLKIADKVGNEMSEKVVTMYRDTEIPTALINDFIDADDSIAGTQINKEVTISGTAYDEMLLKSIEIQYSQNASAADSGWTRIKKITSEEAPSTGADGDTVYGASTSDIANWKVTFDTTTVSDGTYYIRAYAEDSAGHKGHKKTGATTQENMVTVKVDQNSDRPKVYLSNLSLPTSGTAYLKSTKTLTGTVTDDDGIKSFSYSFNGSTWTTPTLSGGGSWSITVTDDGANTVYFKIVDKNDVEFKSGNATLAQPKITDGTSYLADSHDSILGFNVVTKKPESKNYEYRVYNSKTSAWGDWGQTIGKVGGIYTKFQVRLVAKSLNEIDNVKASFNGGSNVSFTCNDNMSASSFDATTDHIWTSGDITVGTSQTITGTKQLEIEVADKAEMSTLNSVDVIVDNTPPTIKITKPSALIGSTETIRGTVDEDTTLYYGISRFQNNAGTAYSVANVKPNSDTANRTGTDSGSTVVLATKWTQLESEESNNNWYVYFDDGTEEDHTKKLATYLTENYLGITTEAAISAKVNPYDTVTKLYFWIKAIDKCGNESTEYKDILIDPQGERPTVEVSYPANQNNEPPTLGGTIRITGTATDNNAAKYVWVQIDSNGNGTFDATDLALLNTNNGSTRTYGYKLGQISTNTEKSISQIQSVISAGTNITDYGIMVDVRGSGWNQSINTAKEFNPTGEGKATLNLTVFATDQDDDGTIHISLPVKQTVYIDARNPYIEATSLQLVQYKKSNGEICTDGSVKSGTIGASRTYTEGMSISGIWFLKGSIKDDDSGIKTISYNSQNKVTVSGNSYSMDSNGLSFTNVNATYNGETIHNYDFQIPLGSTDEGSVGTSSASLYIVENTENNLYIDAVFSVIYDNKAPTFTTDTSSSFYKLDSNVQNSNGFYTLGSIVSEDAVSGVAQSGVDKVVFYFTRDLEYGLKNKDSTTYNKHTRTDKTRDLFDVMIYRSGNETTDVASGNTIIDYDTSTSLKFENDIYWKSHSGTINGSSFTYTGTTDVNIHNRGLAKVNGVIYEITSISGNVITLSGEPGDGTATVYFAIANVINNSGEKNSGAISTTQGYGYGYYPSRDTDDGDLITETFTNQGTDWIFDAAINSKNIPDGPITVHLIAFDKAGNASVHKYNGVVSNNAPRIAGVKIGTDENGNGTVDASELITTYSGKYTLGYDTGDNPMTNVTFPNQSGTTPKSLLTVKGALQVQPELVGGNGNLSYTYSVYEYNTNMTWNTVAEYSNTTPDTIASGTTDAVATLTKNIDIPVTEFIKNSNQIKDGQYKKFTFNFGDSTPGTSLTTGISNNAAINVVLDVSIRETEKAKNWILPFYWNSSKDNSLFNNSKEKGHIELSKDLPSAFSSSGATIYDLDPKVSGMVKLEGIAQDNSLLKEISVSFGKKFGSVNANTDITIATYNSSTGTWSSGSALSSGAIPSAGWASEIKPATYADLIACGITLTQEDQAAITNGTKVLTNNVPYTSQSYGHVVHWIMYLDTSKVENVAAANVTISAKALDRGYPAMSGTNVVYTSNTATITNNTVTQSGGNDGTGTLCGVYKIDIVPYISSITTPKRENGGLKDTNIRSASGKYSVLKGSTDGFVKISGFNFNSSTVRVVNTATSATTTVTTSSGKGISSSTSNVNTILASNNIDYSGYVEVFTNSIRSINNINSNDAHGDFELEGTTPTIEEYENMPNREADYNKTKNVTLTDDRYIRLFNMISTGVVNGYYPSMLMNGDNPVFGYIDNNGGPATAVGTGPGTGAGTPYNTNAAPQRAEFNGTTGAEVYTEYLIKQMTSEQMAMARDEAGRYYNVVNYAQDGGAFELIYDRYNELHSATDGDCWGAGTKWTTYEGKMANDLDNNVIVMDKANYQDQLMVNRYIYPKIITKGNSITGAASVYMAYFDAQTKELCFRDFKIGNTSTIANGPTKTLTTVNATYVGYVGNQLNRINIFEFGENGLDGKYVKKNGNYYKLTVYSGTWYSVESNGLGTSNYDGSVYKDKNGNVYTYTLSRNLETTGKDSNGVTYAQRVNFLENTGNTNSYDTGRLAITDSTEIGSSYFDMGVTSTKRVVIVYYNESTSKLVMKVSSTAVDGSDPTAAITWNTVNVDFPEYVGNYVSMAIDSSDRIHIAAFNSEDSDLTYIYLPSINSTVCSSMTVDQFGSVGNWTQIKVYNNKPYIAYANATEYGQHDAIKLAYANANAGLVQPGTNADTGYTETGWEYMTVPAITPPQGGDSKFKNVCLDFDSTGKPVVGYLGDCIEFGKWVNEQ